MTTAFVSPSYFLSQSPYFSRSHGNIAHFTHARACFPVSVYFRIFPYISISTQFSKRDFFSFFLFPSQNLLINSLMISSGFHYYHYYHFFFKTPFFIKIYRDYGIIYIYTHTRTYIYILVFKGVPYCTFN